MSGNARRGFRRAGALLGLVVAVTGCRSIGPRTVARDRSDYGSSIAESWKRQTLLNIVKLRYVDPPIFVDVGQIVAGYSLETALTAGGSFPETTSLGGTTATVGGSARFTDRPTITYIPLTGNQFVRALMTPLPPDAVFFTIQSGWPADGVLLAAAASLNGLRNQETTIGGVTPPDPGFLRALDLMRNLQRSGAVSLRVKQDAQKNLTTIFTLRTKDAPAEVLNQSRELRELLKLDPDIDEFTLVFGGMPSHNRELAVITRSLLHILTTMAAQVDIPGEDVSAGRATPGLEEAAGSAPRLVRILSSEGKPGDAFVSVAYRGKWFYIDDKDLRSKRAFAFMLMLFTLAETGQKEQLPLITIPAQ